MQESKVQVVEFYFFKDLYEIDFDFKEEFELCNNPVLLDISKWLEYFM